MANAALLRSNPKGSGEATPERGFAGLSLISTTGDAVLDPRGDDWQQRENLASGRKGLEGLQSHA